MAQNGGKREGAGRKSKAQELQLVEKLSPLEPTALEALKEGVSKKEFHWIKLYMEYMYGKPKQILDVTTNGKDLNIPITSWADDNEKS